MATTPTSPDAGPRLAENMDRVLGTPRLALEVKLAKTAGVARPNGSATQGALWLRTILDKINSPMLVGLSRDERVRRAAVEAVPVYPDQASAVYHELKLYNELAPVDWLPQGFTGRDVINSTLAAVATRLIERLMAKS
jgi:hypothetical protein